MLTVEFVENQIQNTLYLFDVTESSIGVPANCFKNASTSLQVIFCIKIESEAIPAYNKPS